jgi:CheY-like chemotaxis protein/anti-sigma regulatory factor (Ser/Thr protein kinase)
VSTNLAAAVRSATTTARDCQRPDVKLAVSVDGALWVRGLATAVEEAVTALVLNAVQAVPDGREGNVDISARVDGNQVVLTVRDNGAGMRDDVVARAFEPFFTTKELGRSSGLGLPVAKGLVETMGGTLELRSILGVGTEAVIRWMLGAEAEISGPKARPLDHAMRVPVVPRKRPRLLLVDDDELVRVAMRRYLAKAYDVDTAASVGEALAMVSRAYDAILSDVVMPDGGGQRFYLELLTRDPELSERVIFITGGAFRGDLQEFLQTQSQPVLNKPVRLSELTAAVGRVSAVR